MSRLISLFPLLVGLTLGACDAGDDADRRKGEGGQAGRPARQAPGPQAPAVGAARGSAAAPATRTPGGAPAGKLDRTGRGAPAPRAAFLGRDGREHRLADFAGAPVLVNLWATWCAPCLEEMPALDRLAEATGLRILPVSQDLGGWQAVDGFFRPGRFKALTPYLDQPNAWALAVNARGLPTTILYDAQGREVWRASGPLDWTGPEAARLIAEAR